MNQKTANQKKERLIARLKELSSLIVAFSGGVDSSFLLAVAHEVLGTNVIAATSGTAIHPLEELENAKAFCRNRGIRHVLFHSDEMDEEAFLRNDPKRCYYCKKKIMEALFGIAGEESIRYVAHGANTDDTRDYRPGTLAAEEAGAIAPLADAGLNKDEIRHLSREMGLATWNLPSMACLASRIPYGSPITEQTLKMIESAEKVLSKLGFIGVRVRHHGPMAVIELNERDIRSIVAEDLKASVLAQFHKIGYHFITLDLEGYVMGKLNRGLEISHDDNSPRSPKE